MGAHNKHSNNKGKWHVRAARNMPTAEEIEQYYKENTISPSALWRDIDPQVIEDGYAEGIRSVSASEGRLVEDVERQNSVGRSRDWEE